MKFNGIPETVDNTSLVKTNKLGLADRSQAIVNTCNSRCGR